MVLLPTKPSNRLKVDLLLHSNINPFVHPRDLFKIVFIFNAIALFTSLAVVVVQITLVRGETKDERQVIKVINKLRGSFKLMASF
nr:At3G12360-like protein [Tanacetum cinerariifolium]